MKYMVFIVVIIFLSVNVFGAQTSQLFIIGRSKNANIVRYDANIGPDGKINLKEPVVAYWLLLAKDGSREELKTIDKKAYGFECNFDKKNSVYQLKLKAFDKRVIKVYQDKKIIRAEIAINGTPAYLKKVFINATEAFLVPKVQSIELFGGDKKTGKKLYEKVKI